MLFNFNFCLRPTEFDKYEETIFNKTKRSQLIWKSHMYFKTNTRCVASMSMCLLNGVCVKNGRKQKNEEAILLRRMRRRFMTSRERHDQVSLYVVFQANGTTCIESLDDFVGCLKLKKHKKCKLNLLRELFDGFNYVNRIE